ncbi:hypothetical protein SAMN02745221_00116 [Thermosyntropha lipolytica DSM 11003]|uniref:AEC family transporter n=1 Tax=Thermosyntropha lipolytica DSM 11003 TaxID=1123382 RepID=A0A1M5JGP2_9FIRM|nr:AEC family transporter [Thermosyntropha lipolytica]SHG39756.1 hypothetical protein SAMN02745221_00116 [Thermosyntropha lipolytica DSM 11003]
MLNILSTVLPVFVVLLAGWILKGIRLIDEDFINTSNKVIFYFFLPVLLFYKISSSHWADVFYLPNIILMYIAVIIVILLSYSVARWQSLKPGEKSTFVMTSFRGNVAYIGLPVCYYAWGDTALALASIYMAFYTPLVNILSVLVMKGQKADSALFVREVFLNPLILSAVLGIMFSFLNIKLPLFIKNSLDIMSGVTMPLSLIAIGATMDFRRLLGNRAVLFLSSMIKLLVMPFLVFGYFMLSRGGLVLADKVLVIFLACPTAVVTYIVAAGMEGDEDLASGAIIISTVLSFFAFIMWFNILQ